MRWTEIPSGLELTTFYWGKPLCMRWHTGDGEESILIWMDRRRQTVLAVIPAGAA